MRWLYRERLRKRVAEEQNSMPNFVEGGCGKDKPYAEDRNLADDSPWPVACDPDEHDKESGIEEKVRRVPPRVRADENVPMGVDIKVRGKGGRRDANRVREKEGPQTARVGWSG
jgi:hypothetical protein